MKQNNEAIEKDLILMFASKPSLEDSLRRAMLLHSYAQLEDEDSQGDSREEELREVRRRRGRHFVRRFINK